MKDITDESIYLIHPESTVIPDLGMGNFVKGYSDKNTPFQWTLLFWLLFPIVGWIFVIIHISIYVTEKIRARSVNVLIYSNGFYIYTFHEKLLKKGHERIVNFDEILAINNARTRHYSNSFYTGTTCQISALDMNRHEGVLYAAFYKNEYENDGDYNFSGYVAWALMEAWYPIALKRHTEELSQKQYTTFYYMEPGVLFSGSTLKVVQIGTDFIKVDENYVDGEFTYRIDDGWLHINPPKESNQKSFKIYLNRMFDSTIFLVLLKEYWGIE